jgi:16S rRNA (guanine527-N7)-methyltransferase
MSAQQTDQLVRFGALLERWNAVHNLTAIESADGVLTHHLLDSLAILPTLDVIFRQKHLTALDVGAGGGLPGVPLAILRPAWHWTLVDKVQKKAAFLTQARVELRLANVEVVHARVETLRAAGFDLIVARAFATLAEFVGATRHLLGPGGRWAAMKGVAPTREIAELAQAQPDVRVAEIVKLAVPGLNAERHLVVLQAA